MSCEHVNFAAEVDVNRLPDKEGGPVKHYNADVRIKCADCGLPFRFIGLPAGLDLNGAATSVDACEARLAIGPKGEVVSVMEGGVVGFSVRNEATRDDAIKAELIRMRIYVMNKGIPIGDCVAWMKLKAMFDVGILDQSDWDWLEKYNKRVCQ